MIIVSSHQKKKKDNKLQMCQRMYDMIYAFMIIQNNQLHYTPCFKEVVAGSWGILIS